MGDRAEAVPRCDVLGVQVSQASLDEALDFVSQRLAERAGGYVCFTNVHAVVTCRDDAEFRDATNRSLMSLADGKPVYWFARAAGAGRCGHVPGPDFMLAALHRFSRSRHFFYGSTEDTLLRLCGGLSSMIPGLNVCGTLSPPFGPRGPLALESDYAAIRAARPDFVWVGLGAPKQEKWMATASEKLEPAILFGVGAAFDFHAGTVPRAPRWLRGIGLEWLFRLASDPRRLWKRYLVTNTRFVKYVFVELARRRM